jgi:hypothetical protein
VLQDLQEETHFSSTELEVLLHHFQVSQQVVALLCCLQASQQYSWLWLFWHAKWVDALILP